MKYEYLHNDGDIFGDYSWERALSIYGDVYPKWCLEFFSMMYFDKRVDRTKLMMEKCIWFRLCRVEKVLTLPEFVVLLELKPTSTNPRTSLIKEPLMRIVHKLLVGSLVQRAGSKEMCQKRDMWMMSAFGGVTGLICGGQYVTKIAHSLGYLNEEVVAKCSKPIEYETWTAKMLVNELDEATHTLIQIEQVAPQAGQARRHRNEPRGSIQLFLSAYEPPNVPPYPYPYVPYPHPYTHYPDIGSLSFGGGYYGVHGDGYHAGSIIPSLGYEIGGSSAGFHGDDFDPIVHSEDCIASDNDEMED
ncbi:hypothetical protein Tco_0965765 [Tanacetum coccineum]